MRDPDEVGLAEQPQLCKHLRGMHLKWHRVHGGEVKPPRILIDGTPWPDLVRMQLDFGHVVQPGNVLQGGITQLNAGGGLGG